MRKEFEIFTKSDFTLEIWSKDKVIFRSRKERVGGLIDFIKEHGRRFKNLIIFDKVIGNAAALLFAYLEAKEVYGVIGSKLAKKTLRKYKIKNYFKKTIPNILNKTKTDLCSMEKLVLLNSPVQFYKRLKGKK
ncbi:DUF1893 domain-containing protein [Patescibacteria group bacterium]